MLRVISSLFIVGVICYLWVTINVLSQDNEALRHGYLSQVVEIEALQGQLNNAMTENTTLLNQLDEFSKTLEDLSEQLRVVAMTDSGEWHTYKATFYSNSVVSTGKRPGDRGYGITKSGRRTELGTTAAVDPKVIPLGSWFAVKFPDGAVEVYRADDTGSGVRGEHVDIFVSDDGVARQLGTFPVEVKIIE